MPKELCFRCVDEGECVPLLALNADLEISEANRRKLDDLLDKYPEQKADIDKRKQENQTEYYKAKAAHKAEALNRGCSLIERFGR